MRLFKYVVYALAILILAFLPFHLSSSPEGGSVKLEKVDPRDFKPVPGKEGGTLRFVLSGDPKTLNPAIAQETTSTAAFSGVFSGLTRLNLKTMEVEPELAQRWESKENGKVWIFHLRRDVRWNDGVPFSAEDVVFTFNQVYYNDEIPSSVRDVLTVNGKKIKVEKIDDFTVKFTLPEPFAPFLNSVGVEILPKHKLERYVKEGTFTTAWSVSTEPKEIVGTGPYVIKEYIKGQRIVYERNPYYYRKDDRGKPLPYITEKVGVISPDPDTALLKFSNAQVDYIGLRAQDIQFVANLGKEDIKVYDLGSTPSTTFLVFNQNPNAKIPEYKRRWFQNRLFRIAISHAIDREGICYLVYNGLAKPLYTPITEANRPYYEEDYYPKFEYDLDKAKRILESIGFKDRNGDGFLEDEEGNRLSFSLLTNAGNKERETIGNIIKEDLKRIGIEVNFQPIDFNNLVSRLTAPPYQWEAIIIGLTGSRDPHFGRNVWHSSGQLHMWNPSQKEPATDWEARLDELIDRGAVELNFKKRVEIYREMYRIITEQQPMIFIATPKSLLATYDKFENLFPTVWGWHEEERLFFKE